MSSLSLRTLTGCVLFSLIVSTLLGNALVCLAVIRFRHLRSKVTNSFVVSLAVSDLCVAVLVMPWRAVSEVSGTWLFGRFCDTWVAFDIMCSTASILNLCVISMDRYWAISSPFRYERRMTRRFAHLMIGVAWTLSILISFIPVQLNWHRVQNSTSAMNMLDCNTRLNRSFAISSSLISFYIPVVIMVGTYTRIFRIAQTQIRRISSLENAAAATAGRNPRNHHHRVSTQEESSLKTSFKRETKVLKTLSVIMGVFVFCWLPFFVLNCAVPFCDSQRGSACVSDTTFSVFVWFGWANSSLNPVIYAFNADFRKAFSTLLGCGKFCSSSEVQAVDFSNELVSYRHDSTLQKEVVPAPGVQRQEVNFDKVSVIFQCEAEICLDLMPFNSSGPNDCYLIPGQIHDL
ncbi:D(5)-like dopamine receptor [Pseudochaenichthys georgianus]|uniref:D(5)-like dopamine receptor n=1 Tax=Pseudochaenichthys georgianus TaxID=52239 RepID=UPI00146F56D2|nr:D(5)-like dopamine receptor [Pseudochaenichthys georgianus]